MEQKGWTFVATKDIEKIQQPITVFLRDPRERFISGLNTFTQHLQSDDLDPYTILYFANRYLFLNRHYAPQFFWLLNLHRFTGPDARVTFRPITDISLLTDIHSHADVVPTTPALLEKIQSFDWSKMELYFYLDQILLGHMGKTVNIHDLVTYIKKDHAELYDLIFQRSLNIVNVLSKT
jgi:hypothetical protein